MSPRTQPAKGVLTGEAPVFDRENDVGTFRARRAFLQAVATETPEVLEDLRTRVAKLDVDQELLSSGDTYWLNEKPEAGELDDAPSWVQKVWTALDSWTKRWNLIALHWGVESRQWEPGGSWILSAAGRTVAASIRTKQPPISFADPYRFRLSWLTPFKIERGWNPKEETRKEFNNRALTNLDTYCEKVLEKTIHSSHKRAGNRIEIRNPETFRWLVRFQIREESLEAIATDVGIKPRTLQDRLKQRADQIGLLRRSLF